MKNHLEDDGFERNIGMRPGRSPLAWLPWLGMKLLAFFADGSSAGGYGGAAAAVAPCNERPGPVKCCYLACPTTECRYTGNKYDYTCPSGYQKTFWFCTEGTQVIGCGECSTGTSCYSGPWACSIWWVAEEC